MSLGRAIAVTVLAISCWGGGSSLHAGLILVTSRNDLSSTDFVDWGTAGSAFTQLSNPFSIQSNGGLSVDVSKPLTGNFFRLDESATGTSPWAGNFAPNDHVLWTGNSGQNSKNPITLSGFNGAGIFAGGMQIQSNGFGAFTARIEAFDVNDVSLGAFERIGSSTNAADNSALFLGVRSTGAAIHSLAISLDASANGHIADYAINRFDFSTGSLTAVPEPSSLALLGTGVVSLLGFGLRRRVMQQKAS